MSEKIRLSTFWDDRVTPDHPMAWADGKAHKPGDSVTVEDPSYANLLRAAGYEATDAKADSGK